MYALCSPAQWCYFSVNIMNMYLYMYVDSKHEFNACVLFLSGKSVMSFNSNSIRNACTTVFSFFLSFVYFFIFFISNNNMDIKKAEPLTKLISTKEPTSTQLIRFLPSSSDRYAKVYKCENCFWMLCSIATAAAILWLLFWCCCCCFCCVFSFHTPLHT